MVFLPKLTWKISDSTQLDFDSEFTQQDGTFDRGVSSYQKQFVMATLKHLQANLMMVIIFKKIIFLSAFPLGHQFNDDWKMNNALSVKDTQLKGFSSEPRRIQSDGRTLERQRRYRDNKSDDILFQTERTWENPTRLGTP